MRSFYSKDEMLVAVAKKKPRLQALVDRVTQMTQEEIQALSEPLWVREGLEILRQADGKSQKTRLQEILQRADEQEAAARSAPQPTYEVRLYNVSATEYVGTKTDERSWEIQVQYGDTFAIISEGQVKFGDSLLCVSEIDMKYLMSSSKLVGYMTLQNYNGFHRELLNRKHKNL